MIEAWLADVVLVLHLGFALFVVVGGFAVLRWHRLAWLHAPAVIWGVLIEYAGRVCPLTPLEVALRRRAGEGGYEGGFLEHYVTGWLYPAGLTRGVQVLLGTLVLGVNVAVYWRLYVLGRLPGSATDRAARRRAEAGSRGEGAA